MSDINDNEWKQMLEDARRPSLLEQREHEASIHAKYLGHASELDAAQARRAERYMLATMAAYLLAHDQGTRNADIASAVLRARSILAEVDRTEPSK